MAVKLHGQQLASAPSWGEPLKQLGMRNGAITNSNMPDGMGMMDLSSGGLGSNQSSFSVGGGQYGGSTLSVGSGVNMDFGSSDYSGMFGGTSDKKVGGGWLDKNGKGGMALGAAQVGLGVYNAMQQTKMNKFMKKYYGNQMALEKADFTNSARSTNEALTRRRERQLSAQGIRVGSDESKQQVGSYMDKWGVDETA